MKYFDFNPTRTCRVVHTEGLYTIYGDNHDGDDFTWFILVKRGKMLDTGLKPSVFSDWIENWENEAKTRLNKLSSRVAELQAEEIEIAGLL